jgi:hypothetical protein
MISKEEYDDDNVVTATVQQPEEATVAAVVASVAEAVTQQAGDDDAAEVVSSSPPNSDEIAKKLIGESVQTSFGIGIVLDYRANDMMYIIKLKSTESYAAMAVLYTQQVPSPPPCKSKQEKADELNTAMEALEKMRRLNLEVTCHEMGIYETIDCDYCTTCLLSHKGRTGKSHFPRLQKLVDTAVSTDLEKFPRLNRLFHNQPSSPTSAAENNEGGQTEETAAPLPQAAETQEQLLQQHMSQTRKPPTSPEAAGFPRLRGLWGSIQSIPQPAAAEHQSTSRATAAAPPSSSPTQQQQSAAKESSTKFPRIRGFLNTSGASDMFQSMQQSVTASGLVVGSSEQTKSSSSSSSSPTSNNNPNREMDNGKPIALPRIQKLIDQRQKANTHACLICASPCCALHSSSSFRKEGITLCHQCERLFELQFIVDCVSAPDPSDRAQFINHLIDCYDRCMLLLKYSSQFSEQIAKALEEQKERQDKVGLASSSVGVLSGVLGIAAAASILTPAGPPLLIASLFFGGGATTVQTGSEAMNYFSEPRKLADRIIALHGMALSILRVTSTLRDAMLRDHIRTDVYLAEPTETPLKEQVQEKIEKNRTAVLAGTNMGRSVALGGVAGVEVAGAGTASAVAAGAATEMGAVAGATGARSATAFSRAGTAAARTVRFARFAGGALSAAVLVMEANAIQATLKSIHDGSPCDKASALRRVVQEVDDFPTTVELDDECQAYLNALASRPPPVAAAEACAVPEDEPIQDIPQATCQEVTDPLALCAPGAVIVDGIQGDYNAESMNGGHQAGLASNSTSSSSFLGGSSLMQRFHDRQELRQHMAMSATEEVVAVAVDDAQPPDSHINLVL